MFAVFQSGGKQHRVSEGDVVRLELLDGEPGSEIVFDKVLMVAKGDDVEVGSPFVEKGQVTAKIIRSDRDKKIRIIKFKRRKDYLKRQGQLALCPNRNYMGSSNNTMFLVHDVSCYQENHAILGLIQY